MAPAIPPRLFNNMSAETEATGRIPQLTFLLLNASILAAFSSLAAAVLERSVKICCFRSTFVCFQQASEAFQRLQLPDWVSTVQPRLTQSLKHRSETRRSRPCSGDEALTRRS